MCLYPCQQLFYSLCSHTQPCCVHAGFWDRLLNRQQVIGLMAQGFQRSLAKDGSVLPLLKPSQQLMVSGAISLLLQAVHLVAATTSDGGMLLLFKP